MGIKKEFIGASFFVKSQNRNVVIEDTVECYDFLKSIKAVELLEAEAATAKLKPVKIDSKTDDAVN